MGDTVGIALTARPADRPQVNEDHLNKQPLMETGKQVMGVIFGIHLIIFGIHLMLCEFINLTSYIKRILSASHRLKLIVLGID